jgi:uncharacterized protein DUF6600/FecR-like protein
MARAEDSTGNPEYGATFGRVRYVQGSLTLQRTGEGELTEATVNDPVVPGDRLTSGNGRSELVLSDGSTLWLDRGTSLDVRNLADIESRYESTNLFALENGAIRIEAPEPQNKNRTFRVDTEAGSVYLLTGGSFRIESGEGVTTLYSFRGVAELSGDDASVLVRTGERSSVQAGRAPSEARQFNTTRLDDFDRFCEERQEAYLRHDTGQPADQVVDEVPYEVQPYMSELAYYGSWRQVPDYGWVWQPVYSGTWGPYMNGYWSWCSTGWVWISYDPWGWAPYHYGRWDFAVDTGWFWIPGHVWGGAWVSFAVGPSHIGWCPLNYYNRPVFQDVSIVGSANVNVTHLQPRGWRFVPVDQFTSPRAPRTSVRVDRLPRGTDVVLTARLPRFDPHEVGSRPERGARFVETVRQTRMPLNVAVDRDNKPLPFRALEKNPTGPRGRRGAAAPQTRERSRDLRGRPVTRADVPGAVPRPVLPQSGVTTRPRARPGQTPREEARPQVLQRVPSGAQQRMSGSTVPPQRLTPPRPADASRDTRPRTQTGNQGQGHDTQTGPAPRTDARRPGDSSDDAAQRLFDAVRGEHGRPRVEAPRVPPPARPQSGPTRPEHPAQAHPPAPRPQPKPKEGEDKHKGH